MTDTQLRSWSVDCKGTKGHFENSDEESPVYHQLVFENLHIAPFIGPKVTDPRAAAVVHFYCIGRLLEQRIEVAGLQRALSCAEFLMPMINADLLVPEVEARNIFVRAVRMLLRTPRRLAQEIRNIEGLWTVATTEGEGQGAVPLAHLWDNQPARNPFGAQNPIPENLTLDEERAERMTPEEAMVYLLFLASHYPKKSLPVELLFTTYVACAKQGQVTQAFLDKIRQGIETETGYKIDIDIDSVPLIYNHFWKDVDEHTAHVTFNRWHQMLPDAALRFGLTMEQILYSWLTVFKVIEPHQMQPVDLGGSTLDSDEESSAPALTGTETPVMGVVTPGRSATQMSPKLPVFTVDKSGDPFKVIQEMLRTILMKLTSLEEKVDNLQRKVDLIHRSTPTTLTAGPKSGIITVTNWGD